MRNPNFDPRDVPSPLARAALFSAHYASWSKENAQHPVYLPDQFARPSLPPVPLDVDDTPANKYAFRCARVELGRPRRNGGPPVAKSAIETPKYKSRPPKILFDDNTWITSVTESATFPPVSRTKAREIFRSADPRCWDEYAPYTFFESTLVGDWNADAEAFVRWDDQRSEQWERNRGGLIQEKVVWNWNDEVSGGATNVIEFFDVKHSRAEESESYSYKYRLHHCETANFIGTSQPGGIDVDEGLFHARWKKGTRGGVLDVTAVKRLHYTQQPDTPKGFDLFMNLMAPALASMFMRQLVSHSIEGIIDGTVKHVPPLIGDTLRRD